MPTEYPVKVGEFNLRLVSENLYVSGVFALAYPAKLSKVDTVIDLIGTSLPPRRRDEDDFREGYKPFRQVLALPIEDCEPIPSEVLDEVYDAIISAKGAIWIHCAEGVSRSVSVAYAMLRLSGLSQKQALKQVLSLDGRNPARVTLASAESWVQRNLPA